MAFYRAQLPACYSEGSEAYPVRPVDIVRSASGSPIRKAKRSQSYREFHITFAARTRNMVHDIISHYELMGGSEHSFPVRDKFDFRSGKPEDAITALDARLGVGDGVTAAFQCTKQYKRTLLDGVTVIAIDRTIKVLKVGTLVVAVDGVIKTEATHYTADYDTGIITFTGGNIPTAGQVVTAGFEFYVKCCYGPQNPVQTLAAKTFTSVSSITLYEVD